jgi:hypothetical protein
VSPWFSETLAGESADDPCVGVISDDWFLVWVLNNAEVQARYE